MTKKCAPVLFIPHGGGPLPLLNDPNHEGLSRFLKKLGSSFDMPKAILMISAHWEEDIATISGAEAPDMIFDYYGFPEESYQFSYPAPGSVSLANKVLELLKNNKINAQIDPQRGFDHGTFVPLMLMYPKANVPIVQLSLVKNLDPETQINLGQAIGELSRQQVMIIGSGFSFHNLKVLMGNDTATYNKSVEFDDWLNNIVINDALSNHQKQIALTQWIRAPHARFVHPREEHLLPLHVCFGVAESNGLNARNIFNKNLLGVKTSAFLWQ